jgi:hypothetical protein
MRSGRVGTDPGSIAPYFTVSTETIYRARAKLLAALPDDAAYIWHDFAEASSNSVLAGRMVVQNGGSGQFITPIAGSRGGTGKFSTGATAGSFTGGHSNSAFTGTRRTTKYYLAARMRVLTAVDAQARLALGLYDPAQTSPSSMFGVFGTAFGGSNANFVLQYDGDRGGSFVDLGKPIDTAYHIFELYNLGDSVIRCRVDGGTEFSATLTGDDTLVQDFFAWISNGTTAADRSLEVDWALAGAPRS